MTVIVVQADDGNYSLLTQSVSDSLRLPVLPVGASVANATGVTGLTQIVGTSVNAMRSDASPALSQSISPIWSNNHKWSLGNGLMMASGTNGRVGTFTLSAGSATIANTSVTANTMIFFSKSGTSLLNLGILGSITKTAGTGFSITSTNILDTSSYQYLLVETF